MNLTHREMLPELMDDPALDLCQHQQALRGLGRINRWSGSARILWPPIRDLARQLDRPLRVLDIATGGGDVPIALSHRARQEGLALDVSGCDVSPQALAFAAEWAAQAGVMLHLFPLDALRDAIPEDFDVITTSLFLHHLSQEDGISLLQRMAAAARHCVLVNDLVRHKRGYWLAWIGTRMVSRSRIVRIDGPLSVRAAYSLDEARRVADAAGLISAQIEPRWPCRFLLTWLRS